jgi:hypothetical protein
MRTQRLQYQSQGIENKGLLGNEMQATNLLGGKSALLADQK